MYHCDEVWPLRCALFLRLRKRFDSRILKTAGERCAEDGERGCVTSPLIHVVEKRESRAPFSCIVVFGMENPARNDSAQPRIEERLGAGRAVWWLRGSSVEGFPPAPFSCIVVFGMENPARNDSAQPRIEERLGAGRAVWWLRGSSVEGFPPSAAHSAERFSAHDALRL